MNTIQERFAWTHEKVGFKHSIPKLSHCVITMVTARINESAESSSNYIMGASCQTTAERENKSLGVRDPEQLFVWQWPGRLAAEGFRGA